MSNSIFSVTRNRYTRPGYLPRGWPDSFSSGFLRYLAIWSCLSFVPTARSVDSNLLHNPGFEAETTTNGGLAGWSIRTENPSGWRSVELATRSGRHCLELAAHSALEQRIRAVEPGAYVLRCWVKSEVEQPITILIQEPDRPWLGYNCCEQKVPKGRWIQLESFCCLSKRGDLFVTIGGVSREFRNYHGAGAELESAILIDDCELVHNQPDFGPNISVWEAGKDSEQVFVALNTNNWRPVANTPGEFHGVPVFRDRQLTGRVEIKDGSLALYSAESPTLRPRGVLIPDPPLGESVCALIRTNERTGLRIGSAKRDLFYIVWLATNGVVEIEPQQVTSFRLEQCNLSYGVLPSFVGTDLCYSPEKLPANEVRLPSTQWFVGLGRGKDSMLVVVWDSEADAVSLGLKGLGTNRVIDSFVITPEHRRFAISFVEHTNIWHREVLNEDWLSEYVPIHWQRPFAARWMGQFFVSPTGRASFREPNMFYSFPIATAKTRLWGVWFEDWNYFPLCFDGQTLIFHFDKSFAPNGEALVYFLEPAAANLFSPCEIVSQFLGEKRASELFDFEANQIRRLNYSTPNEFVYDRPVCATTTRLSKIGAAEKRTVGLNLATHLYEFIREIRSRVDQYGTYFESLKTYLSAEKKAHPDSELFIAPLLEQIQEAQAKLADIYAVPLADIQQKTDSMKAQLLEGKGDGFDCGKLDVRGPAGAQDDLCRRYNRLVLKLTQTAALNCGDSLENVRIAQHLWGESRKILRLPTRWEPRRTLYFFEP